MTDGVEQRVDGAPNRRATSADVAREAGVSRATVSYVLNNVPNRSVAPATRALVLDTAARLGHVPHASARALRLGRTNVVLALVRDFTFGHIADQVLEGLDAALAGRGYVLLVNRYSEDVRQLDELWRLVDPAVVVSMSGLSVPEASSIQDFRGKLVRGHNLMNRARGGEMQAEYLFSRGHRNLAYAYPVDRGIQPVAQDRLRGTQRACARLGIPEPAVIEVDKDDIDTAAAAIRRWREMPGPITAICAHNDELAIMLQLIMSSRQAEDGKPLPVIGIDDIPLARVGITTIAIDVEQVTSRLVEMVIAALENRPAKVSRKPVLRLVVRDSA